METLPRDIITNIALLTDASSCGRLQCVCTTLKTQELHDVTNRLARQETQNIILGIVDEVKQFEAVIRKDDFMLEYLKELAQGFVKDYQNNNYNGLDYTLVCHVLSFIMSSLTLSFDVVLDIFLSLTGIKKYSVDIEQYHSSAINAVRNAIMNQVSEYSLEIMNNKIILFLKVRFVEDDEIPELEVYCLKSSVEQSKHHKNYIIESEKMLQKMISMIENLPNEDFAPLNGTVHEDNDHDDEEEDEEDFEEENANITTIQSNAFYDLYVRTRIPDATVVDRHIIFKMNKHNVDGIIDIIHSKCGEDVFVKSIPDINIYSLRFTSKDSRNMFISFDPRFDKLKKTYMHKYFGNSHYQIDMKMCL